MRLPLVVLLSVFVATASAQLTGVKICIDPGHGGHEATGTDSDRHIIPDPGVDFWESESNFRKALHLRLLLEARGAIVLLTRNTNDDDGSVGDPSLSARVALANSNNVDWFHSIHSNATGLPLGQNTSSNSTLMLVREKRSESDPNASTGDGMGIPEYPDAWTMSTIMSPIIRQVNRTSSFSTKLDWTFYGGANDYDNDGVQDGFSLGVLRGLLMPGELSEGSFHDFYPETRRLMNNDYRKGEAYALTRSFQLYFGAPADAVGIVAGLVMDPETGRPKNGLVVRLLPENRVYTGDNNYNGFYMFDSLTPGPRWIRFENTGYALDSVQVTLLADTTVFADRTLLSVIAPYIVTSTPIANDTSFPVKNVLGVQFSRAMDTASVRNAFHVTPPAPGTIYWGNDRKLIYDPVDWLAYNTVYTMTVDTSARSTGGVPLDATNLGVPNELIVQFRTQSQPTSIEHLQDGTPTSFTLLPAFPNPFNPTTQIRFGLPNSSFVRLSVTDLLGREVARLVEDELSAGYHTVAFNAISLPSGFYFASLQSGTTRLTIRMILLK